MNGNASDPCLLDFGLARVDAATKLKPESRRTRTGFPGAANCPARAVEYGQHPVACSVDLLSIESCEFLLDLVEERRQYVAPARIAELDRPLGGSSDIEEEDRD